jgi:phosphoribosylanthranilate isomerase
MNPSSSSTFPFIVKICGITTEEDARIALDSGANALGFNFYRNSPRYILPERAFEIAARVCGSFLKVGIFVNPAPEELTRIASMAGCEVIQLHGDNFPAHTPPSCRVWRCVTRLSSPPAHDPSVDAYLLDAPSQAFGGSGKKIDWALAASFPHRKILAGGLDAMNVAAAIAAVMPNGVDACSRLESSPGRKDPARVRDFVRAALCAAKTLIPQETL